MYLTDIFIQREIQYKYTILKTKVVSLALFCMSQVWSMSQHFLVCLYASTHQSAEDHVGWGMQREHERQTGLPD